MTRAVLYVVLLGLSLTGDVPYWALPCLVLYDINWFVIWNSPKRLRALREYKQLENQLRLYDALKMPGAEVDE